MERSPHFFRKAFLSVLIVLSFVVTASLLAFAGYSRSILGKIQYVDPTATSMLSQEALDQYTEPEDMEIPQPHIPQPDDIVIPAPLPQESRAGVTNILLIGQDRRPGEARARSDTILLCTLDPQSAILTLTSFLRDLYVTIPGYRNNRINASYTAGGMALLDQTLEANFGIAVDGCIEVDFQQFPQIIDLLGGVSLELRQDEAEYINSVTGSRLSAGVHLLGGSEALAYARIRKLDSDGDFSRTHRQRKLLEALLQQYRDAEFTQLAELMETLLPMVTTDLNREDILSLVLQFAPMLPRLEIRTQFIPEEGTYTYRKIRGMSVLVADMEAARTLLQKTIAQPDAE